MTYADNDGNDDGDDDDSSDDEDGDDDDDDHDADAEYVCANNDDDDDDDYDDSAYDDDDNNDENSDDDSVACFAQGFHSDSECNEAPDATKAEHSTQKAKHRKQDKTAKCSQKAVQQCKCCMPRGMTQALPV